jgi:hypothetical protein
MGKHVGLWLCLVSMVILGVPVYAADNPAETASTAVAVEPPPHHALLDQPLRINLGAFYASVSNLASLGGPGGGAGVAVDFGKALDLPSYNIVGEASMRWRFTQRWRLDVDYFNINRHGTRTLTESIDWNGTTIPIGSEVEAESKFSDLRTAVGYSFFQRADKEVGLGLGLHVAQSKTSITTTNTGASSANVTAPLPVLVFYSNFALTNTWAMSMRLDWLSLAYGDYSGQIRGVALDFLYQPYQHVGFGFGWHSLLLNLDVAKTDWSGTMKSTFQGPAAFVSLSY